MDSGPLRVLIAFSGGIDSSVLLHVLNSIEGLDLKILGLLHINHNLRADSKIDENFAKAVAADYSLPCHILDICPIRPDLSSEAWGREIRYRFFEEKLSSLNATHVFTAHHLDDEIETFIFRLIMGRNNPSFELIKENDEGRNLVRPLLNVAKSEIEKYAKVNNVRSVLDMSNFDETYARNFIRHTILPEYSKLNPNYKIGIKDFISNIRSDAATLDEIAKQKVDLPVDLILKERDSIAFRILIHIARRFVGGDVDRISIRRFSDLLEFLKSEPQGEVHFDMGSNICAVFDKRELGRELEFLPQQDLNCRKDRLDSHLGLQKELKVNVEYQLECPLLGDTLSIEIKQFDLMGKESVTEGSQVFGLDLRNGPIMVSGFPMTEDMIVEGLGRKRISRLLKEKKLSLRKRKGLFYFKQGNETIWIPGVVRRDPIGDLNNAKYLIKFSRKAPD